MRPKVRIQTGKERKVRHFKQAESYKKQHLRRQSSRIVRGGKTENQIVYSVARIETVIRVAPDVGLGKDHNC